MSSVSTDNTADANLPLSVAFTLARQLYQKCQTGSPTDQDRAAALKLSLACQDMIDALALFSSNEDIDDLATADIKYLLVPFFIAEVLAASRSSSFMERIAQVNTALTNYRQFLDTCGQYGLLGGCGSVYQREEDGVQIDVNTRREIKISCFKRQKELNNQLSSLESNRPKADGDDDEASASAGNMDEEDERRLWLLHVELSVLRAMEARPPLKQEAGMLEARMEAEKRSTPAQREAEARRVAEQEESKRFMMSKLQEVMAQLGDSRREQLRREVFRPSHTMPTLTVEQAGEIEYHQMLEREAAARRRVAEQQAADDALPAEDREDRELERQRAMDDFKDANKRGWGNSKLRPCG